MGGWRQGGREGARRWCLYRWTTSARVASAQTRLARAHALLSNAATASMLCTTSGTLCKLGGA
eukprot:scaffold1031_cov461-Prasinococcus_capsulatus_cf.AAC.13